MRMPVFALRCAKEMVRDKLNMAFGLGFPLVVMGLLTAIQANIPVELFAIGELTPGIAVFGLSFVSLFSGTVVAKDRSSSFLMRLYATPMTARDFILGYTLPMVPLGLGQSITCLLGAVLLGLRAPLANMAQMLVAMLPAAWLFTAIGLAAGSFFNDKQVGGVCGALLTNLSAWLSGTWFSLDLVGGAFKKIAYALPFARAVDAGRLALKGNLGAAWGDLAIVALWAAAVSVLAVVLFRRSMKKGTTA